ncbi:major facilitator superfamily domain-containing protein [Xylaria bambusicola]|uniref:major facilitator superfamily domain-containing protein n=1 Tax=Xylaria bambusicola TaxID=326684 RepID=UPI0020085EDB|nr:major facilitator superfamily domain-containing protein [Xylaria bambusicola]KAI0508435.1 major facilitator superfamily domain-containing protein [Xylaria bambusicola]
MLEQAQGLGQHQQNGSDETEPLLSPGPSTGNAVKPPLAPTHQTRCTWPWIYVVLFGIAIAIVAEIGEYLFIAPRVRLFESVSCTRYYLEHDPSVIQPDGSVPEYLCKVNRVQDEVTSILGWQLFFDSIPAIILPLPFGYLADRYGRRWILFTAMIGYTMTWVSTLFFIGVLQLPLQYVWLSSIFLLIGGGSSIATTMLTTIVADVVPPDLRTTVFFYRFCAELIAECFVPPFTYLLMERDVWIPLLVALGFQVLATAMASLMPETLPVASPEMETDSLDSSSTSVRLSSLNESTTNRTWIQQVKDSFAFATRDKTVAALIFTFLISKFGRQSSTVLFQYVSKRYKWRLSQAGLLLSVRAGVNILLFTVILPLVINFVLSNTHTATRDLWIGQVSIVLMTIGVFIIAVAATATFFIIGLVVYTFGTGFPPIIRSLVTLLVESHHESQNSDIARLYAIISVLEGIGSLLAGPGTAWAFRWGLSLGESWFGLPYLFATILFAVALVTVFSIRVK